MIEFIRQVVLPQFGIDSVNATISRLGNGHINHTFFVTDSAKKIVLQRINTSVFTLPEVVVNNAAKISRHLSSKRQHNQYALQVVSPVMTDSGDLGLNLGTQGFWRAIDYIEYSHTIEVVTQVHQAEVAAHAFGHFASALSDMPSDSIVDVIPNFLNLPQRIHQLTQAAAGDTHSRLSTCQKWVDFVLSQTDILLLLADFEAKLPRRICHNDTKINNMLFDKRDMSSMAIIDLDTCMSGYLMYDFGDMVRAFCSPEPEDSTALNHVYARPEIIISATNAYVKALSTIITPLEKQSLWLGIKVMALMLGTRFLSDYLSGDVYFTIEHPQHNLDRALNQLTIYQSLVKQEPQLISLFN
ncbi:aminoglycoside phosphotransferase family protein [Shewanella ulleungensis]|uniref:Aminoglycoside phosphotransferase n=1 Tax=Shewanella ulleungensis TaxID=2282699 RepID=A0ABQ2QRH0_9GAMM|nr:aminoglycoside phosphotransferase family protein [Shewanella ulleungensis]MCL1150837.1 aminoglycoside phosphotransferase family protein [Shewanella ulleungensis]GGP93288.1 aminoglycoside phosphotransferase [Shewanella ulleungensis]